MLGKKMLVVSIVSMLATACSMEEFSAANKKVSDSASNIMNTLRGSSGSTDNGMPHLSPSQPSKKSRHLINMIYPLTWIQQLQDLNAIISLFPMKKWILSRRKILMVLGSQVQ